MKVIQLPQNDFLKGIEMMQEGVEHGIITHAAYAYRPFSTPTQPDRILWQWHGELNLYLVGLADVLKNKITEKWEENGRI